MYPAFIRKRGRWSCWDSACILLRVWADLLSQSVLLTVQDAVPPRLLVLFRKLQDVYGQDRSIWKKAYAVRCWSECGNGIVILSIQHPTWRRVLSSPARVFQTMVVALRNDAFFFFCLRVCALSVMLTGAKVVYNVGRIHVSLLEGSFQCRVRVLYSSVYV